MKSIKAAACGRRGSSRGVTVAKRKVGALCYWDARCRRRCGCVMQCDGLRKFLRLVLFAWTLLMDRPSQQVRFGSGCCFLGSYDDRDRCWRWMLRRRCSKTQNWRYARYCAELLECVRQREACQRLQTVANF